MILYFVFFASSQEAAVEEWKAEFLFQILFHPDNMVVVTEFLKDLRNLCISLGLPPKLDLQKQDEA